MKKLTQCALTSLLGGNIFDGHHNSVYCRFRLYDYSVKPGKPEFKENPEETHEKMPMIEKIKIPIEKINEYDTTKHLIDFYDVYKISIYTTLGIFTFFIIIYFIFKKKIAKLVSKEVAYLGSKSLDQETLKKSAGDFSKQIISSLLDDPQTSELSLNFLQNVLGDGEIRTLLKELSLDLLTDEGIRNEVGDILKTSLKEVITEDEMINNSITFLERVFSSEEMGTTFKKVFATMFNDTEFQQETGKFFEVVLKSDSFIREFSVFSQDTLGKVFKSKRTEDIAQDFFLKIFQNEDVVKSAGQFLYNAAKVSITPKWMQSSKTTEKQSDV